MFIEIVNNIEGDKMSKTFLYRMAKIYGEYLPDSLYLNHYQLSEEFGFTPMQWNEFLKIKEIDQVIESEIAQIAEIGARHALANLMRGQASSADIQAARELLANSKLLQQKTNQRPQVVLTRIPYKVNNLHDLEGSGNND